MKQIKIDTKALDQVDSYAFAVAADERFKATSARWVFWAVSNELTDSAYHRAHQVGRPEWISYQSDDKQITIIAKPWSQIIEDCRARLNFYQEKLRYAADLDSAKEYLQKAHAKYLPDVLSKTEKKS